MGERLLEQRAAVDLYLTRHNKRQLELTSDEWILLEKVVRVLEPMEEASKQMCRADEPLSIQFPIATALDTHMAAITDPELQQMRVSILNLLSDKFNLENNKYVLIISCMYNPFYFRTHALAMFLDPRFKDRYAVNKVKFNTNVATWIQEECEKNINPGDKGLLLNF